MTAITIAATFSVLNLALLAILLGIWGNNYRQFRTPMVLGLVLFALVMAVENATAIYFVFFSMRAFYAMDPVVQNVAVVHRVLQFVALSFLTWASLQ